ncbi:hypothetical protein F4823DRAFT_561417 [Ustulina deusta]|nr:hypothetical protein F4823DRAFT_561417 [Ustulina deusta]
MATRRMSMDIDHLHEYVCLCLHGFKYTHKEELRQYGGKYPRLQVTRTGIPTRGQYTGFRRPKNGQRRTVEAKTTRADRYVGNAQVDRDQNIETPQAAGLIFRHPITSAGSMIFDARTGMCRQGNGEVFSVTAEPRLRARGGDDEMVVGINNGLVTNSAVREAAADELSRAVVGTPDELAGDGIGMGEYGPDESHARATSK